MAVGARLNHAVTFQYTSVVLLILSLLIGALARDGLTRTERLAPAPNLASVAAPQLIGNLNLTNVFMQTGNALTLNVAVLQGLKALLLSHDISAEFEVPSDASSMLLVQYLVGQGVPPAAILFVLGNEIALEGVNVRLLRENS